jgi:acyl-CoA thioester hydrolase
MPPHVRRETARIVMSEVDVAQIHFTALFRRMDSSLCHWLAEIGHPFTSILETGPGIPIIDSRCRFMARVVLDDLVTITTFVTGVGRTSFRSRHLFTRDGQPVAEGELVHVCVDRSTRATVPVPDWIRAAAVDDPAALDLGTGS